MTARPAWLADTVTDAASLTDVAATLTVVGHALQAGEVDAQGVIDLGRQIRSDALNGLHR